MNDHDDHETMETEIVKLSALERMRKRAADDDRQHKSALYLLGGDATVYRIYQRLCYSREFFVRTTPD